MVNGIALAADKSDQADVQIIMGGRQYDSFADYRLKRMSKKLRRILQKYKGDNLSGYIDGLQVQYNKKYKRKFGLDQITLVFDEMRDFFVEKDISSEEATDDYIAEMREMLTAKYGKNADPALLDFDPSKVKTFVVP